MTAASSRVLICQVIASCSFSMVFDRLHGDNPVDLAAIIVGERVKEAWRGVRWPDLAVPEMDGGKVGWYERFEMNEDDELEFRSSRFFSGNSYDSDNNSSQLPAMFCLVLRAVGCMWSNLKGGRQKSKYSVRLPRSMIRFSYEIAANEGSLVELLRWFPDLSKLVVIHWSDDGATMIIKFVMLL
ncbi:hypothetical protein Hanom_Chr17g01548891 [Helianthus anomalus]